MPRPIKYTGWRSEDEKSHVVDSVDSAHKKIQNIKERLDEQFGYSHPLVKKANSLHRNVKLFMKELETIN